MARSNRVGGVLYFDIGGLQLELEGKLDIDIDQVEREGKTGLTGGVYYTEKPKVPMIEATVFVPDGFPMDDIRTMVDGTITAALQTGQSAVLSGATFQGPMKINGASGTTDLAFIGTKGMWI